MGKMQRTKGASGENEVVHLIEKIFPDAARELEQYQGELGRDLRGTAPLCIQVKRHKTMSPGDIKKAFSEAVDSVDATYVFPMVFYREDRKQWRAYTDAYTLFQLADVEADGTDADLMIDMEAVQFLDWYECNYLG